MEENRVEEKARYSKESFLPVSDNDCLATDYSFRQKVESFGVVKGVGGDVPPRIELAVRPFIRHHQICVKEALWDQGGIGSVGGGFQALADVDRIHDIHNAQNVRNS